MKCAICGGTARKGKTTVTVDTGDGVVVVRSVPAHVCRQCGEEWLSEKSAADVEKIVQRARKGHAQVEVVALA